MKKNFITTLFICSLVILVQKSYASILIVDTDLNDPWTQGMDLASKVVKNLYPTGVGGNSPEAEEFFVEKLLGFDIPGTYTIYSPPVGSKITSLTLNPSGWDWTYAVVKVGNFSFAFQDDGGSNSLTFMNLASNPSGAGYVGLSHVTFFGSPAPVPEPATMLLFGTGIVGLVGVIRKKRS
jgi:hypothetical protein